MTDRKAFLDHLPAVVKHPATVAQCAFDRLPLSVRVADRLTDVLVAANELRDELGTSEKEPLQWIAPEIDRVLVETNALLNRLAS